MNLMLKNSHEPMPTLATHSPLNTMAIAAFTMMANIQYVIQLGLFKLNLDDDEEEDFGEQVHIGQPFPLDHSFDVHV